MVVELDEYVTELTKAVGFVIVLHDAHHVPLPQDEGIMVPPGYETRLGARRVRPTDIDIFTTQQTRYSYMFFHNVHLRENLLL